MEMFKMCSNKKTHVIPFFSMFFSFLVFILELHMFHPLFDEMENLMECKTKVKTPSCGFYFYYSFGTLCLFRGSKFLTNLLHICGGILIFFFFFKSEEIGRPVIEVKTLVWFGFVFHFRGHIGQAGLNNSLFVLDEVQPT